MARNHRVTIKDIAREVGISAQTVSRVLNDRPDVSAETRQRVKEAMARANYLPSALARSLIHQQSMTLGVVTAGLGYLGPSRVLNGITYQAEKQGYTLILKELLSFDDWRYQAILDSLYAHQVDGIIWAVPQVGENHDWLDRRPSSMRVPMLLLASSANHRTAVVNFDGGESGRLATTHLLANHCRHIGHISGPLQWWIARERKRGWEEALQAARIEPSPEMWAEGDWSAVSGKQALEQLLVSYPNMDGVFVANDQMALGAMQAAHQAGLAIPDNLAVIGIDNTPEAAYFHPPLSSIEQDQRLLGREGVQALIRHIHAVREGQTIAPVVVTLPPKLVIRESSRRLGPGRMETGQVMAEEAEH